MNTASFTELYNKIQKAIELEREHKYVDFVGRSSTFSQFVLESIGRVTFPEKKSAENLRICFEQYAFDSLSGRRSSIDLLWNEFEKLKYSLKREVRRENPFKTFSLPDDKRSLDEIDVTFVKGVGPGVAKILNKLGVYSVEDLLKYYPRRYVNYEGRAKIADLELGMSASIMGVIRKVSAYITPKKLAVINVIISDGSDSISISYFYKISNRRLLERYKAQYPVGSGVIAYGTVKKDSYTKQLTLDKPEMQIVDGADFDTASGENEDMSAGRIVPVYALTEGFSSRTLVRAVSNALQMYGVRITDPLPEKIRAKYNLMDRREAFLKIHFPKSDEDIENARFRIVFEELFVLQLSLALIREKNRKAYNAVSLSVEKNGLVETFMKNLPFELTGAQKNAVREIAADLNSTEPMQRLLQGDVGSGKTVVACIALLCAIENGYQGAIMAPTEILASQHYKNFVEWLTPLGLSVGLFLGKHSSGMRSEMKTSLKNGQMHVAVGTHALIQEGIEFNKLGMAVIDEQHRFGVKQRAKLLTKGESPQMLTMTATPIPRTLALTLHGDLDLTIIDEMPKGRLPVKTELIGAGGRKKAYELIKEEIKKGKQAYIVYPLIDESETISARNATQEAKRLSEGEFKEYRIGLLHGKLKAAEKEEVMLDFKNKKYDILVSTTVVEVGVDVPNATVMIIENAERFGLSQLHQLRGRVGRSSDQSYCILVSASLSAQIKQRLSIMTQTNNGFIVAEKDLELRGPGEFLGTRQSGITDLGLADIVNDVKILDMAREEAFSFVKEFDINEYPQLKKLVQRREELIAG